MWFTDQQRAIVDLNTVVVDGLAIIDIDRFEMSGGGLIRTRWARAGATVHPTALRNALLDAEAGPVPAERETIATAPPGTSSAPVNEVDPKPSVAHPHDDEFDGSSTVAWADTPVAPVGHDVGVSRKSNLTVEGGGANASAFVGRLRPLGDVFPVTVTTRLNATTAHANHQRGGGILITQAAPVPGSTVEYFGVVFASGKYIIQHLRYSFDGVYQTFNDLGVPYGLPLWLRAVFQSPSVVVLQFSFDGLLWVSGFSMNLNQPAAMVGLGVANEGAVVGGVRASFEYLRSKV